MSKVSQREKQIIRYFFKYVGNFKAQLFIISILLLISSGLNLYLPLAEKTLLDSGLMAKDFRVIVLFLFIIFGVKLANDSLNILQNLLSTYITNRFIYNVSKDTFGKLIRFPMPFFERFNLGELTSRLNGDIGSSAILVDSDILEMIKDAFILIGIIIIMAKMNFTMFLISLLVVPMIVYMNLYIARRQKQTTRAIRSQYDVKTKRIQEVILGIQEIKVLNIFKWAEKNFLNSLGQIFREELRITRLVSIIYFISNRFHTLVHTSIYLYGAYSLVKGRLTVGELFAFLTFFERSIFILERLVSFNRVFQSALVSMERVYQVIEEGECTPEESQNISTPDVAVRPYPKIVFENVSFRYSEASPVLTNISFAIEHGEKVALVGANGSGKTTILKLLTDLVQLRQGDIYIDGINLRQLSRSEVAQKITYVTQHPFIFQCSIKENLLLANRHATLEELEGVIQQVGLKDFVDELPERMDTPLTLSGTNLSGGQLQRLAIARALLKGNEVMVLDEPTSNIEEQFEERFIMNLVTNNPEQTVIMTVHKESLLKYFDRVLYVGPSGVDELGDNLTTKYSMGREQ